MGNSLAVRQFSSLCKGVMQPCEPILGKICKVETLGFRLCLRCNGTGDQDVITFADGTTWRVCRMCRQVIEDGKLTEYQLMDNGQLRKFESEVA